MTEETKPVEREGFEKWAKKESLLLDRVKQGEWRAGEYFFTGVQKNWEGFQVGWDAALERAAEITRQFNTSADSQQIAATIERSILALKGRR